MKIILSGGLGNQLFQLAAAYSLSNGSEVILENKLGSTTSNPNIELELEKFILPDKVHIPTCRDIYWLEKKLSNYFFLTSSQSLVETFVSKRVLSIAKKLMSLLFQNGKEVQICQGVGYDGGLTPTDSVLFGYFQTYKWLEDSDTLEMFQGLRLKESPDWLIELEQKAAIDFPLILHMRRGDYVKENTFGIPSKDYYEGAVRSLWKTERFNKIWIFSDEPTAVREILPDWILANSRIIVDGLDSPASTIQAMRLGKGYVLSNSTFGWWGAKLSYNQDATVIVPKPWFKIKEEPRLLIPKQWVRQSGWD